MKGHVQVYRNINKTLPTGVHVYSVRGDDGLVKKHTRYIHLKDCKLRVGKKGKQRVRDEKRKNVHAYIQGKEADGMTIPSMFSDMKVTYNPYKNDSFVCIKTGKAVHDAAHVMIAGRHIHVWL